MAATNTLSGLPVGVESPAGNAAAISKDDNNDLTAVTRGIFVGGAGNIVVTMLGGGDVTFTGVVAGTILPIRVTRVKSTNTTATNMVALW